MTERNLTLCLVGAALLMAVFCGWRGARKPNPFKGPRLIPWSGLMALSVVFALFALFHFFDLIRGI